MIVSNQHQYRSPLMRSDSSSVSTDEEDPSHPIERDANDSTLLVNSRAQQYDVDRSRSGNEAQNKRPSIILNGKNPSNNKSMKLRKTTTRRLSWADMPLEDQTQSSYTHDGNDDVHNETIKSKRQLSSRMSSGNSSNSSIQTDKIPSSPPRKLNPRRKSTNTSGSILSEKSSVKRKLSTITAMSNQITCMQDGHIDNVILEQKKSNAIWCLRILTVTTLTTATVIVAVLTFTFTRNSELQVFDTQYQDSVVKVAEAISLDISNKLNSASAFSAMYTSRYGPEERWPNVTMPYFEEQARGLLDTSGGIALSFNPIITNETRAEWEAHANESAFIFDTDELIERSCDTCRVVADGIFRKEDGLNVDDSGYSPESRFPYHMVPVWQIYPTKVNWRAVMFNLHSEKYRQRALDDMLEYKVPTVTGLLHLVQHTEMDPSSILFFPVVDQFYGSQLFKHKVVGSISIVFTWADILRSVLPGYIKGLIVVLEKSTTEKESAQIFTYHISGDTVTLLGEGDRHDPNYDEYEHEVVANVAQEAEILGIVDFLVTYKLKIYPSKEFEQLYLTIRPLAMTLVVLVLFIFTSSVFLFYDYLVYNRQNAIMKFAQRSGHIVNSMFPSGVRERLFTSTEHQLGNQESSKEGLEDDANVLLHQKRNPSFHIKQFLKGNFHKADSTSSQQSGIDRYIQNTPPIADFFHNTTIMFADMVSFTAWSSEHSPEDVFYLLETLFLEFDKAAERLGVFKLGTIGKQSNTGL